MRIADMLALGFIPLRHDEKKAELGLRNVTYGLSVENSDLEPADSVMTETVGDLIGATLWRTARKNLRPMPAWNSAWSAQTVKPAQDRVALAGRGGMGGSGGGTGGGGGAAAGGSGGAGGAGGIGAGGGGAGVIGVGAFPNARGGQILVGGQPLTGGNAGIQSAGAQLGQINVGGQSLSGGNVGIQAPGSQFLNMPTSGGGRVGGSGGPGGSGAAPLTGSSPATGSSGGNVNPAAGPNMSGSGGQSPGNAGQSASGTSGSGGAGGAGGTGSAGGGGGVGGANAAPSTNPTPSNDVNGVQAAGAVVEAMRVVPTYDGNIVADERFEQKMPGFPNWATRFPLGYTGVVTAGTNEDVQQQVWHPDFLGLVASGGNPQERPDLTTAVLSLDESDRVDPLRRAVLYDYMRVVKQPTLHYPGQNAISWNWISDRGTGKVDYNGGIVSDMLFRSPGRTSAPVPGGPSEDEDEIVATSTRNAGFGPAGNSTQNPMGHGIMSWRMQGPFVVPEEDDVHSAGTKDADGNAVGPMHLTTDALWIFQAQNKQLDGPLNFEGGVCPPPGPAGATVRRVHLQFRPGPAGLAQRGGKWDWWSEDDVHDDAPRRPPTTTTNRKQRLRPRPVGPTPNNFGFGSDYFPTLRYFREVAFSSILFSSQSYRAGDPDYRNFEGQDEGHAPALDRNPIVGRLSTAWATTGAGGEPTYTQRPGQSRHRGGTASGIIALLPGEIGFEDYSSTYAPGGITRSSVIFAATKGLTKIGSGIPNPTTGLLESGNFFQTNSASTVAEIVSTTSAGVVDKTRTLANRDGGIVLAPSALTADVLPRSDANGDLVDSGVKDNGTVLSTSRTITQFGSTIVGSTRPAIKYNVSHTSPAFDLRNGDDSAWATVHGARVAMYGTGNGSYSTMLTPAAPSADKTVTIPNLDLTMVGRAGSLTSGRITKADANGNLVDGPSGGVYVGTYVLTSGTTHTTQADTTKIRVRLVGGGGGGGGGLGGASKPGQAGGGAAGGYAERKFTVTGSTGYTYAIGAAGSAGTSTPGDGGTGGDTTFTVDGVTVTAFGGLGGSRNNGGNTPPAITLGGASPAVATNGDVNSSGAPGGHGFSLDTTKFMSGAGGSSQFGSGGAAITTDAAGAAGIGYGSGGSGAMGGTGGTGRAGGAGTQGIIIVDEYS